MTTPFDSATDGSATDGSATDGSTAGGSTTDRLSPEQQRLADHRDLSPQERQTAQDYVGSGNDAQSSAPRSAGESADDGRDIGDRTEPGDGGRRISAHRPAAGVPEGADPAQRPMEGTSEEFPVAEGVRTEVHLDEPVRRHGERDAGLSFAGLPAARSSDAPLTDATNELTETGNPYPASTWGGPVTEVHRAAAPDGEVSPE